LESSDSFGRPRLRRTTEPKPLFDRLIQLWSRIQGYNTFEIIVELAVIWVVVYVIFRFLRGTRGARVLKGVTLVLVIAAIIVLIAARDEASFQRLRFLGGRFLAFLSLALIIVFQPELRRALVRIGEARFFRGPVLDVDPVVDAIVQAATFLSGKKIGALIAIEREVGLAGITDAGTRLNAEVTAELLQTIFWPGSALHDMGVVIHRDKVVAAGVQFPLAEGDEISQELGSRHRAAVGLSQEADCLVVVVSEETGAISLAERGQLVRKLAPEGLRAMLRRGLTQQIEAEVAAAREAGAELEPPEEGKV